MEKVLKFWKHQPYHLAEYDIKSELPHFSLLNALIYDFFMNDFIVEMPV